ncbi:MAG: monovalent cation/H+ antiporter complex subunit F [Acidimicrobiales bacterium]
MAVTVDGFLAAGIAMMLVIGPAIAVVVRGGLMSAVVAYELVSSVAVMVLICLAEGFGRSGLFELAVLLAVLLYGSGLVFVRTLERWL